MAASALGFLLIMAVGGAVCGIADLVHSIVARLVAVSVTVTKQGGVNTNEFLVA